MGRPSPAQRSVWRTRSRASSKGRRGPASWSGSEQTTAAICPSSGLRASPSGSRPTSRSTPTGARSSGGPGIGSCSTRHVPEMPPGRSTTRTSPRDLCSATVIRSCCDETAPSEFRWGGLCPPDGRCPLGNAERRARRVIDVTGVRASVVRSLRRSPGRVGFGLGLVAVLLLWAEAWAPHPAGDTLWFAVPWWGTLIGIGMATALVARGRWGWAGLIAALVGGATLLGVADALLQPDNPYTQGLFMGLAIDVFVGWWTVGASIGVATVSAARLALSVARSRGGAATTSVGVDEPPESQGREGAAEGASGPRPARDRRPRGLVAVALVGVIALAALAIWQPWNPPGPAYFPFPSVPAPA